MMEKLSETSSLEAFNINEIKNLRAIRGGGNEEDDEDPDIDTDKGKIKKIKIKKPTMGTIICR